VALNRAAMWPVLALTLNALTWGLSWWPLRRLEALGLHPLWATALVFTLVVLLISLVRPGAWVQLARAPALWVLVLAAMPWVASNYAVKIATFLAMYGALALSWNFIGGYTGYPSFATAAFVGLGAYTGAIAQNAGWMLPAAWLAGAIVPVDAMGLFLSTVQVVLLPLVLGLALHHYVPRFVTKVLPVAPLVSVVFITLIVASVIGQNAQPIRESGGVLLLAVLLLHAGGFGLGYLFAKLFGYDRLVCRTISIEVGMQNSGLGVVLAKKHFAGTPAPVPFAVSSVFHSVIGSLLAAWWRRTESANQPPK